MKYFIKWVKDKRVIKEEISEKTWLYWTKRLKVK